MQSNQFKAFETERRYQISSPDTLDLSNPYLVRTSKDSGDASENARDCNMRSGKGGICDREERNSIYEKQESMFCSGLKFFSYFYSTLLLSFCVILLLACIFDEETTAAEYGIPPIGAFFLLSFLICWLSMMEGGLVCLAGLQSVDKDEYADSHPRTFRNTTIAHQGDNMERFIVGRQLLMVLVIFLINMVGSSSNGADPLGLPRVLNVIFLENGVALIVMTIVIGQLASQVSASASMVEYINNYFMLFTTFVSLGIEFSGLTHFVYLVQIGIFKLSCKPIESNEPPRSRASNLLFWCRVLVSTAIISFSLSITLEHIIKRETGIWKHIPATVSVLIFLVLMCVIGLMEGTQIAAFAVFKMTDDEISQYGVASASFKLLFTEQNLQAFIVGRQIIVTSLIFVVARISMTSTKYIEDTKFGDSSGFKAFLDTGLLGALVLTIIGSLLWRIIASSFPLVFMSNPLVYILIHICLMVEATGVGSSARLLGFVQKHVSECICGKLALKAEQEEVEGNIEN